MREVLALVLAGGSGERLSVLCAERAVSAIPFGGKYRLIDFVLSNCCHSGVSRVGILTQHAPTSLHDHLGSGRPWDLDRREGGVIVLQPYLTRDHAGWYRGTADAVAQNWDHAEAARAERVLVLSGDQVYRMDYRALLEAHVERRAAITLSVCPVPAEQSHRFGMVTLGPNWRVREFEEKPQRTGARLASMGIYVFEAEVLREALRGRPVDLALDVLRPLIEAGERIYAHEFSGYWEDVGTLGTYYQANMALLEARPRLQLNDPRWPILTRDEERPPVLVMVGASIESSLVANGCRVSGRVVRSVLSPGVTVEAGAEIVDSVIMQDVFIGRNARVERAILDKYVSIGAGARIGGCAEAHDGDDPALGGLTLLGKYVVVPEGATVGREAVLGVGAGAEDFVDNRVAPGTRIPGRPAHFGLM